MININPLVPTQEKFARLRSVQKCTFLVFRPKFDSVPSKIFLPENNSFRQNSIFFLLMPFKKSYNLPFGRDGQKTQGRSDQKLLFFLFFTKKGYKKHFSNDVIKKLSTSEQTKVFSASFRAPNWNSAGRRLITRVKRASMKLLIETS